MGKQRLNPADTHRRQNASRFLLFTQAIRNGLVQPSRYFAGSKKDESNGKNATVQGTDQKPHYARAKTACAHFQIARSTLWQWIKQRKDFPQPLKAGPKVSLHDINAIDAYLKAQASK